MFWCICRASEKQLTREKTKLTTQHDCTLKKANVFTHLFKLIFLSHPDNHDNEGFFFLIKVQLYYTRQI